MINLHQPNWRRTTNFNEGQWISLKVYKPGVYSNYMELMYHLPNYSPKAIGFDHFRPENGQEIPVYPVNPVYCSNKNRIHSIIFSVLFRAYPWLMQLPHPILSDFKTTRMEHSAT
jgi:hypothetical protein